MRLNWFVGLCVILLAGGAVAQTNLTGAGATFPYPMYSKWFSEYHNLHPDIQINYQSIGSGGGVKQIQAGTVDFGASDGPMTDEELKATPYKVIHNSDGAGFRCTSLQPSWRQCRTQVYG